MSDLRPGIYKIGNLTIIALTDGVMGVAINSREIPSDADYGRARKIVQDAFPDAKAMILSHGDVSYATLSASADLRRLIQEIVSEELKR